MRHGKKFKQLSRKAAHRKALLSNLASALILKKRIFTTLTKGRELRKYVEPLLTKAKSDTMHSRRVVFSYLQNKYVVKELFDEVAQKIADRPGGYTRIIKIGQRRGDASEMCMIELVDYNELLLQAEEKKTTRRSRRRRKGSAEEATPAASAGEANETPTEETNTDSEKKED
ncbi:MAG: 50S ribosomal protein L17 [Bernardetiaceae bacterium]